MTPLPPHFLHQTLTTMDDNLFNDLEESVREAGRHARGELDVAAGAVHARGMPNARAIREAQGLTQTAFAAALGVPVKTLQNWEQGRRRPEGAAVTLLRVAAAHPEVLLELA